MTNTELLDRMMDEYQELHGEMYHRAYGRQPDHPNLGHACHEAIDLANFAMMFFDNNRDHYGKLNLEDFI